MAVTLTADALAAAIAANDTTATRLLAVAAAVVERYAPAAPEAIQNEAALRFAGYLFGSAGSGYGAYAKTDLSGIQVEHTADHGPAFRRSGAKGLLSPWAPRNLGVC